MSAFKIVLNDKPSAQRLTTQYNLNSLIKKNHHSIQTHHILQKQNHHPDGHHYQQLSTTNQQPCIQLHAFHQVRNSTPADGNVTVRQTLIWKLSCTIRAQLIQTLILMFYSHINVMFLTMYHLLSLVSVLFILCIMTTTTQP